MRLNLILRTAICLEAGLFITFTQDHNISVGLQALASFGIGYALITVFVALLQRKRIYKIETFPQAALALVLGMLALETPSSNSALWFRGLIVAWGLLSGGYELFQSNRVGRKTLRGKELQVGAVIGLALGALYVLAPFPAVDEVGFFGAYLMISAVHLGISAASDRSTKSD